MTERRAVEVTVVKEFNNRIIKNNTMSMYWILFIGIAVISYIVQNSLQSKFKKYSKMPLASGMTGKDVAEKMLHDNGIYDVRVTSTPGMLTDHYSPANKTVNLSDVVY